MILTSCSKKLASTFQGRWFETIHGCRAVDGELTIDISVILDSCSNTAVRNLHQHLKVDGLRQVMVVGAVDGEVVIDISVVLASCSNTLVRNLPQHFKVDGLRKAMAARL